MLDTKEKEIQRLEEETAMRQEGIKCSRKMLAQDTTSFVAFFNKIKNETSEAAKRYEEKKKEKNRKGMDYKKLSESYLLLVSQINKNIDNLLINYEYKEFLDSIQRNHQQ